MENSIYPVYQRVKPYEYEFITVAGVIYACYFISAATIFSDYPDTADLIYSFNLDVEVGNNKEQKMDEKIGNTVIAIIKNFLLRNQTAVVYLCDMSDGRQILRKRKFNSWFRKFEVGNIIKLDREISLEHAIIFNSLLISESHPLFNRIIAVFEDFNHSMNNK